MVIARGLIILFKTAAEEKGNGLVEPGRESALVFFDNIVAVITGLPVNQFH